MKPLVLFHGACRDGFCAAWAAYRLGYRDAEFIPVFYGQPPPRVLHRDVLITDFCYERDDMQTIGHEAKTLIVFDHHKTAPEALAGLEIKFGARVVYDVNRSGSAITWDELHGGKPRPWLVDYTEDRDLWRHALPSTEAINAFISTLAYDFEVWDDVYQKLSVDEAQRYGLVVGHKIDQYVREVAKNARMVMFMGERVPLVNAPQVDISELLHVLCEHASFAVGWFQRSDGMFVYSLRTRRDDIDVSEIAKSFGGGGHRKAAGFQVQSMLTFPL
jgi:oligoribonuclease NrnB/cAMP/cGMP phosphodiesterase (DHH superfamily)